LTLSPPRLHYRMDKRAPWYYTNCRLEDIAETICCVDNNASHRPVIGMLLRYANGRRACVGQFGLGICFLEGEPLGATENQLE